MSGETGIYHCTVEELPQSTLPMRMRWAATILEEADARDAGRGWAFIASRLRDRAADWDRP